MTTMTYNSTDNSKDKTFAQYQEPVWPYMMTSEEIREGEEPLGQWAVGRYMAFSPSLSRH